MMTLQHLFQTPIVQRLGLTLVHSLWQGIAVAIVLAMALPVLRRAAANTRYLFCCGAMLIMVLLPVTTLLLSRPPESGRLGYQAVGQYAKEAPAATVDRVVADDTDLTGTERSWDAPALVRPVLRAMVMAWLAGVVGLSMWRCMGWVQLRRLERRDVRQLGEPWGTRVAALAARLGVGRAIRLGESGLVSVPTVFGWLRPMILVPASALSGLTLQQLEALLAHELAHVRRNDYLVNIVQIVIETLMFYHPAVWWISRQMRQERENCCDDLAAEVCGDRLLYARSLATMEELRGVPGQWALAANGGQLLSRVRRILGYPAVPARVGAGSMLVVLTVIGVVVALSVSQLRAEPREAGVTAATTRAAGPTTSPIRPDDTILVSPPDRPAAARRVLLVYGEEMLTFQGKETTWEELPALLKALPERANTVLQVSPATENSAMADEVRTLRTMVRATDLQRECGLAGVKRAGKLPFGSTYVNPPPRRVAADGATEDPMPLVYVFGVVQPGAYAIGEANRGPTTLKQLIDMAKGASPALRGKLWVRVSRREGLKETATSQLLQPLLDGAAEDDELQANDVVEIGSQKRQEN